MRISMFSYILNKGRVVQNAFEYHETVNVYKSHINCSGNISWYSESVTKFIINFYTRKDWILIHREPIIFNHKGRALQHTFSSA